MDPRVVALPQDLDAEHALQHLRDDPEHTLYNLYVVDAEQRLVGVLNLRELLVARRRDTLVSVMQPAAWRLRADADRHAIVSHPGWWARRCGSVAITCRGSPGCWRARRGRRRTSPTGRSPLTPSGTGPAPLRGLLDLRHPLAYLALHPTLEFGRREGVGIDWLPLTVPPLNPPSAPGPDDDRGVRHRRYRAQAIAREIEAYGRAQGLVIREPYRDGDVGAANLAWLWVRERLPEALPDFLVRLFRGYWSLALDASSREQVAARVDAARADGLAFLDWCDPTGTAAARDLAVELREAGIFQVPAFVVEDQVFYGRQHLPMIRWILAGRPPEPW